MPGVKNSDSEIKANSEAALAEAIGNLDAVDGQSVAGLLNQYLDVAISSRSSHGDPDPNGYIDAPISGAGASQSDIEAGVNNASINQDIYQAIERRVSQVWDTQGELSTWSLSGASAASDDSIKVTSQLAEDATSPTVIDGGSISSPGNAYDNDTATEAEATSAGEWVGLDFGSSAEIVEFRFYAESANQGDGEWNLDVYDGSSWTTVTTLGVQAGSWSSWQTLGMSGSRIRLYASTIDAYGSNYVGEIEVRIRQPPATATSPAQSPSTITKWDIINFDASGSVTVDIVDDSGTVLKSGVTDGNDISDLSAETAVSLEVTLESGTSALDNGILRWIE